MFRFHGTKCALLALSLAFGAACEGWQDGEPFEAATNTAMSQRTFTQRERLANPLVSEVTVRKARHHLYNLGSPSTDVAQFRDDVNAFVTGVAGRDPALANAISGALLPAAGPSRSATSMAYIAAIFRLCGGCWSGRPLWLDRPSCSHLIPIRCRCCARSNAHRP